ncbi:signal peptidase I SipW [Bacillus sp. 1P06AnD]|uniref:signal peptidase I SipW n=1 Tax=Bacillus sp. 1P06AnD TaxID=3132208 RepID=UPI0039A1CC0E
MKKTMKIISNIISVLLVIVLLCMIFIVVSTKASGGEPQAFGYKLKTVLSGSMEPEFMTGSIIAVQDVKDKKNLKKGDVITFMKDEKNLVTHRIVEVMKNGEQVLYKTKGDNNKVADTELVQSSNVVAEYSGFTVPYLGYFLDFAKSPKGTAILLIGPGVLLLGYSVMTIIQAVREIDRKTKRQSEPPAKSA